MSPSARPVPAEAASDAYAVARQGNSPQTVVLSIAGSDPSGGAGIQADLKTFAALGAYGTCVITALTAQSTTGVTGVHAVPAAFVAEQLETLLADVRIDAVKIGMLANAEVVDAVTRVIREHPALVGVPTVLDPVMVSSAGSRLLADDAVSALLELIPHVDVITPNAPEAAVLLGTDGAVDVADLRTQARALHGLGARRVLLKGGHLDGGESVDVWSEGPGADAVDLSAPRVATTNTHGTGCTLSSAIAALRPHHDDWLSAVRAAKDYVTGALEHADELSIGQGPGPLNHAWPQTHVSLRLSDHD
ncbi:bifunctional hydroxymethylpyrimidine kinase/phosphomethylpyrimidine kinase [Knoellia sp. CPCC 206453]|uniref:bifunctional hydroxymethylpyrimidine kinase/phosphomethylpyrimidine kinase n=1 Tax=Knoellia pratensis TaxID=3404796 RepID=UPI00361DCA86